MTVTQGGAAQGAMVTVTRQRFVETPRGTFVRAFVQAGTDANDYTLELQLKTHVPDETAHRILEPRALLQVNDVSE